MRIETESQTCLASTRILQRTNLLDSFEALSAKVDRKGIEEYCRIYLAHRIRLFLEALTLKPCPIASRRLSKRIKENVKPQAETQNNSKQKWKDCLTYPLFLGHLSLAPGSSELTATLGKTIKWEIHPLSLNPLEDLSLSLDRVVEESKTIQIDVEHKEKEGKKITFTSLVKQFCPSDPLSFRSSSSELH